MSVDFFFLFFHLWVSDDSDSCDLKPHLKGGLGQIWVTFVMWSDVTRSVVHRKDRDPHVWLLCEYFTVWINPLHLRLIFVSSEPVDELPPSEHTVQPDPAEQLPVVDEASPLTSPVSPAPELPPAKSEGDVKRHNAAAVETLYLFFWELRNSGVFFLFVFFCSFTFIHWVLPL